MVSGLSGRRWNVVSDSRAAPVCGEVARQAAGYAVLPEEFSVTQGGAAAFVSDGFHPA